MMQVTSDQWLSWLSLYFWPLLRVLALISTAPILSERSVPKRVKLGLAMMITFAIAPSLPANDVPVFSFFALWLAVQQILIGIALGFTMQFAFAAVRTAGEIIGLQMGLSFATFVDPASHLNMPVLARIMDMLALLLFLTFNGHLWLISLLVDTFHTLPIRFTESYGPAIIHFCYWISINSDCRYLFNGGINAVNCAFLRTFIQ